MEESGRGLFRAAIPGLNRKNCEKLQRTALNRESNPGLPGYEAGLLTTTQHRSEYIETK